jgi:hypothetical protein
MRQGLKWGSLKVQLNRQPAGPRDEFASTVDDDQPSCGDVPHRAAEAALTGEVRRPRIFGGERVRADAKAARPATPSRRGGDRQRPARPLEAGRGAASWAIRCTPTEPARIVANCRTHQCPVRETRRVADRADGDQVTPCADGDAPPRPCENSSTADPRRSVVELHHLPTGPRRAS